MNLYSSQGSTSALQAPSRVENNVIFPSAQVKKAQDASTQSRCARICCCCCPRSKVGRIICSLSILAFLVLIILLCYFFIPRLPEFKVLYVQVRAVNGDIPLNITQNSNNPLDLSIQLPIFMGVSVINPNIYDLNVDNFDLTAYIRPNLTQLRGSGLPGSIVISENNNPARKVGYGTYGSRLFPGRNYNTTFEIEVLLSYSADSTLGLLNDPTFGELAQACGLNGTEMRTMSVEYDVGIRIAFLSRLGINPVIPNQVDIKCPLSPTKIKELNSKISLAG